MKPPPPLLSVIIPTHKRPQYLNRAIRSALQSCPSEDLEVIVVPNGPDESWTSISSQYAGDSRVKWIPIAQANANAARNHGLQQARGTYIRFLDDDDYFYPGEAQKQIEELIQTGSDLSFANINIVDDNNHIIDRIHQIETNDYIAAAISPTHSTATMALVYKKSLTHGVLWDEQAKKRQDVYWAWSLCIKNEIKAIRCNQTVGAWVEHNLPRISKSHSPNATLTDAAQRLIATLEELDRQGRLNGERTRAASDHLWQCVHQGLMYEPIKWLRIAEYAKKLDPEGRPSARIYQNSLIRKINPILCEMAIAPWRWMKVLFGHEYRG